MMFEFLMIVYTFIFAIITFCTMMFDAINNHQINFKLLGACIFFTIIFLFLIKPTRDKTPAQIKASWKYKDYQAVYDYINTNHPNLNYEPEDRERLAILLFFDWVITDDSNPEELILTRITNTSNDTQIFQPTNKKSL